jgi:hypothetical protein
MDTMPPRRRLKRFKFRPGLFRHPAMGRCAATARNPAVLPTLTAAIPSTTSEPNPLVDRPATASLRNKQETTSRGAKSAAPRRYRHTGPNVIKTGPLAGLSKKQPTDRRKHLALVARLSPLGFDHINMLGRYAFIPPDLVARGELRPLRDPAIMDDEI